MDPNGRCFFLHGYHWSYLSSKVLGFHVHFAETKNAQKKYNLSELLRYAHIFKKNAHLCQKMVQQKL